MMRFDAAIARLYVSMYQGRPPNKRNVTDMMPWPREEEEEATLQDLFNVIQTAAAKNRRKMK
jgi:hypothetical protein